jgi:hypothetical protein
MIRSEGRAEGLHESILAFGTRLFGPPPTKVVTTIHSTTDPNQPRAIPDQINAAQTWQDLVGTDQS